MGDEDLERGVDQRLADAGQGPADEQRPDKDGSPARERGSRGPGTAG
jgi:hypothetical protein